MFALSLLCFWLLMLFDFFKNIEIEERALWGFALVFLSWGAALAYYFLHFRRRHC